MSTPNERAIAQQLQQIKLRQEVDRLQEAEWVAPRNDAPRSYTLNAANGYRFPERDETPRPVHVQVRSPEGYLRDCQPREDGGWVCGVCLQGSVQPYLGETCLALDAAGRVHHVPGCGAEVVSVRWSNQQEPT